MENITVTQLANKHEVRKSFVSDIINGHKKTSLRLLAIDIAAREHQAPIEYISKNLRKTYLGVWPELMEKL